MRRLLTIAGLLLFLTLTLHTPDAGAAPPCSPRDESLALTPTTAAFNGAPGTRSAVTGRYTTDAGLEFDHEAARVDVLPLPAGSGCMQAATQATLQYVDPFTGARRSISLAVTP